MDNEKRKVSKAELGRRKEARIYAQFDRYLELYLEAHKVQNIFGCMEWNEAISAFMRGCYLADGRKWYNRLQKRYQEWAVKNKIRFDEGYSKTKEVDSIGKG